MLTGSAFESLKSGDLNLISNPDLRDTLVLIYGKIKPWVENQGNRFYDIMLHASQNLFNTRFVDVWNTDSDNLIDSEMIPLDYEQLKNDQEYLYFIRSLPNYQHFQIDVPANRLHSLASRLLEMIENELNN
jgi:hypothetical protein